METQKLNVLVLPDLFPKDENDWVGVFVVDYLKSVMPYSTPWVFYSRLTGNYQQVQQEAFNGDFDVYRWSYKKKINSFLKPFYYLLWFKKSMQQIIRLDRKIDVIHAHGAILNGTIAYYLSKQLKVPFVISEHTGPFSKISDSLVKKRWAKSILNKADKVFAVSNHLKEEIAGIGVEESNIEVSYNPVDTDLFTLRTLSQDARNMLFVSRLEPFKGGLRTLKAFHQILKEVPNWTLTICGEGAEKKEILTYISKHQLKEKVTVKSTLTKKEYAEELQQASFLVFPSLHESFGLIPVEAMACGVPVIATQATAMPEYIHAKNGLLLQDAKVETLGKQMLTMIQQLGEYDSASISREIRQRFGIDQFGKQLTTHYHQVIKTHSK